MKWHEWALAILTVAATVLAVTVGRARPWTALLITALLLANLLLVHRTTMVRLLPDGGVLYAHRDLFEMLKQRMTAQERVHLIIASHDFSLTPRRRRCSVSHR